MAFPPDVSAHLSRLRESLAATIEFIRRLADFGVPSELAGEIRRRRSGERVELNRVQRRLRARTARRVMAAGVGRVTAEDTG